MSAKGAVTAIQTTDGAALVEKVVIGGDLSKLTPAERLMYYQNVCESVGLNPLTRPFDYLVLNGKTVLYAKRDATDQLRKIHGVSVTITSREKMDDVYVVTAKATMPDFPRSDESIGAVNIAGLKGDALANALMKAETKAKRRVTLSICGLGLLDETEVETIPGATSEASPPPQLPSTVAEGPSRDAVLLQLSTLGAQRYGKGWRDSVLTLARRIITREFKSTVDLSTEELGDVLSELEQAPEAVR